MSDLNEVKRLIDRGDKEDAVAQLASIIIENRNDVEAWLLLGETIDDPSRKKDCYRWALKLSPDDSFALRKLQELEAPASRDQTVRTKGARPGTKGSLKKSRPHPNYVPMPSAYPTISSSNDDTEIISYFIVGIVAFLVILYVIVNGDFAGYSALFCGGLIFLGLSTVIMILVAVNKNRA